MVRSSYQSNVAQQRMQRMPAEPPSADALVFDSHGSHVITILGCLTFSASLGAASGMRPVKSKTLGDQWPEEFSRLATFTDVIALWFR